MKKVLVIQPWGIGDMIMMTPMLRALRLQLPKAELTVVAKSVAAASVIADSELCDAVETFHFQKHMLMKAIGFALSLRRRHFDLGILATRLSPQIALLLRVVAGIPVIVGDGVGRRGWAYTHWRRTDCASHRVGENLAILRLLFPACTHTPGVYFHVDEAARWDADKISQSHGLDSRILLGIHPGGSQGECKEKRLPVGLCREVMDGFLRRFPTGRVLLFFGPDDQDVRYEFKAVDERVLCVNDLKLRTVGALVAKCRAFVSGDAGLGHVAAALGVPVVTVAGPTDMRQTRPWGNEHQWVATAEDLSCRPCYDTRLFGRCPFEGQCMTTIAGRDVLELIFQICHS